MRDGSMSIEAPVIVFDGNCLLCSRSVRFVLRHDRAHRFRFAAQQGVSGQALLARHGLDPADPPSFLLVEDGHGHLESEALLRVLRGLGGGWRLAGLLRAVPRPLRDAAYRWIARNRYRWFGRSDACLVPGPDVAARFLP
ncbi:thiol-disulfide oxidoreductase DCC family protein [Dokdonella koreensis]|nr:thiol-disulfide oxidoreductase DCC family protein [Dokdonella koreensis]